MKPSKYIFFAIKHRKSLHFSLIFFSIRLLFPERDRTGRSSNDRPWHGPWRPFPPPVHCWWPGRVCPCLVCRCTSGKNSPMTGTGEQNPKKEVYILNFLVFFFHKLIWMEKTFRKKGIPNFQNFTHTWRVCSTSNWFLFWPDPIHL